MANWEPLTTLPTDLHDVDVLVIIMPGGRQLVARYRPDHQQWIAGDERVVTPTHWQPLPELPPADLAGGVPPVLTGLDPAQAALGDPNFTLHVTGEGFVPNAVILWNGGAEPTTVVSETEVTTEVNMATASVAMPIPIQVRNGLGGLSNTLTFALTGAQEAYEAREPAADAMFDEAPHAAKRSRPRRDA